jgi:hypothetical membrane protein
MLKSFYPLQNRRIYDFVMVGCGLFIVLTIIAMFFYPGGTLTDETTRGYSFFENFFSDLGLIRAHAGGPNTVSALLFFVALNMVGVGMGLFFLAFPQFFQASQSARRLSAIGSVLGILAALSFLGVAFTPADVNLDLHKDFVIWAFRFFPAAVLFYTIVMFREGYPKAYCWVFVVFFALLIAYMLLLELGPDIDTYQGMAIQAVGQKIIVYASITSTIIQAWGARRNQIA